MTDGDTMVGGLLGGSGTVSAEQLNSLWWSWCDDSYAARRGREAFLGVLRTVGDGPAEDDGLGFRLGGWQIDLGKTAVQSALVTAILGGALAVLGVDQVPVEVLPAVIPLVVDVRRSRLSASDAYVLAQLVVSDDVRDGSLTVDELYAKLPEATRDDLSRADFEDFLDSCRRAGVADRADGKVALREQESAVPHHVHLTSPVERRRHRCTDRHPTGLVDAPHRDSGSVTANRTLCRVTASIPVSRTILPAGQPRLLLGLLLFVPLPCPLGASKTWPTRCPSESTSRAGRRRSHVALGRPDRVSALNNVPGSLVPAGPDD